jgi:hypothetical protein
MGHRAQATWTTRWTGAWNFDLLPEVGNAECHGPLPMTIYLVV